ncbi:MAG: DNA replication/repair protein RecF [Pseudomonadota bacterium]
MFTQFQIENFRNIAQATLQFSSGFNLIVGDNGAGKTSILEAMAFLARGQSYRTTKISSLIKEQCDYFQLLARLDSGEVLGLRRSASEMTARMNGLAVTKQSAIAQCIPLYFISPGSHELIEGGPEYRRRFIDWGVFHLEQGYSKLMQEFRRTLKQRNAALQSNNPTSPWDSGLIRCVEKIDKIRKAYVEKITPLLLGNFNHLTDMDGISLSYHPGWRQGEEYAEQLTEKLAIDRERGFTSIGPHRADLMIKVDGVLAREYLSRGQQKLAVIALILSQAALSSQHKIPLLLIDDLASELDKSHQLKLLHLIGESECQTVITSTSNDMFEGNDQATMFHVEHGSVASMG